MLAPSASPRSGWLLAGYAVMAAVAVARLIMIAMGIAGRVFGQEGVRGEVSTGLRDMLGDSGAQAVDAMLAGASKPTQGVLATVIGLGTLMFAALGVVVQLKDALNTV